MTLLAITPEDIAKVEQILDKFYCSTDFIKGQMRPQIDYFDKHGWNIENFYILINQFDSRNFHIYQLNSYFLETKNFDLAKLVEKKIKNDKHVNKKNLNFYKDRLKSGYYPDNNQVFIDLFEHKHTDTLVVFKLLLDVSMLCKDDKIAADLASLIIKKRNKIDPFSLMNIEKLKTQWSKSKNLDYVSTENGYYIQKNLDLDILSHQLKVSLTSMADQFSVFFRSFKNHLTRNKDLCSQLSIKNFKIDGHTFCMFYGDKDKKDLLTILVNELIQVMIDNRLQKQSELHVDEFFTPYLRKILLDSQLANKTDKSVKIKI